MKLQMAPRKLFYLFIAYPWGFLPVFLKFEFFNFKPVLKAVRVNAPFCEVRVNAPLDATTVG